MASFYSVQSPSVFKFIYPKCIWHLPTSFKIKTIYLTFDDGPHPTATPFVLEQLKAYNAHATFFCIGNNVVQNPQLYNQILAQGHAVGNHTHTHPNGWQTNNNTYIEDIIGAQKVIKSNLFRPPYGRIKKSQEKLILSNKIEQLQNYKIIMWSVLSGDFDTSINGVICATQTLRHIHDGAIIVFHDSEKALPRLQVALPIVLKYLHAQGYSFQILQ
jgi:peptidoglycan/xylan/chitin deacetylase (PgdA/CDA1 family)